MRNSIFHSLDISTFPRQRFGAGESLLDDAIETDRLLLLSEGRLADTRSGRTYGAGQIVMPLQFFGASHYAGGLVAKSTGELVHIPREVVQKYLHSGAPMTWTLARAVAIETLSKSNEPVPC